MTTLTTNSHPLIAWQRLRAAVGRPAVQSPAAASTDRPTAVVFRCADSGITSEAVFGQRPGSLIEVATWGHAVDSGVMGSLEYAVGALEVPLIVVLGHHNCHAMKAAHTAWDAAVLPEGATRTTIEQVFGSIVRRGARADSVDDLTAAHMVETGLSLLERSPLIARRIDARQCGIVCAATTTTPGKLLTLATVGAVGESGEQLLECV